MQEPLTPLIKLPELLIITGTSKNTIYRWMRARLFPKQHRIGPRAIAWKREDVQDWLDRLEVAE